MDAKEYLNNIKTINTKINILLEHLEDLKAQAITVGSSGNLQTDRVQSSLNTKDKLGDIVAKIGDLEAEINKEIDIYVDEKHSAIKLVASMDNPIYIQVLNLRYLNNKSFEEIAVNIGFSWRHTIRLHGYALQEFQKLLDKKIATL